MFTFLKKWRDWLWEDVSNQVAKLEQKVSRLENEMREIREKKTCCSLKKIEEFFKAWKNTVLAVSATATLVMAIFAWAQARSATAQAKLATEQAKISKTVLRQQAFSRVKIGFNGGKIGCSFIFANSGINPIQDGKKAVLLITLPIGEKPIEKILLPIDLLDPDDPKSISFHVPPPSPSGTNLFAFAVFHGTQEFLGEKRPIAKAKMMYRFGATWFEAPETFVTTGKCETEIIGAGEQPILWEILQQFRSLNEKRGLNSQ